MKKGILRGAIALALVFAMSVGMLASAAEETIWGGIALVTSSAVVSTSNKGDYVLLEASEYGQTEKEIARSTAYMRSIGNSSLGISQRGDYWYYGYAKSNCKVKMYEDEPLYTLSVTGKVGSGDTAHIVRIPRGICDENEVTIKQKDFVSTSTEKRTVNVYIDDKLTYTPSRYFPINANQASTQIEVIAKTGYRYDSAKSSYSNGVYTVKLYTISYTINYELNGGTDPKNPTSYNVETATFSLKNPTREGYKFHGWTGTALSSTTASVSIAKGSTGDRSYAAQWTANTYYVSFDGNGATGGSMTNQTFKYGVSQALSENKFEKKYKVTYYANSGSAAKAEDYAIATFNGWDSQNAIALAGVPFMYSTFAATEVSNPATLVASSALYSDKQVVSNLTAVDGATVPLIANWSPGSVTLPTATKTGYVFKGWYSDGTKIGNASATYTPTADITLTASWETAVYTIKWVNHDGTALATEEYEHNETPSYKGDTPTKASDGTNAYEFTGWSPDISPATTDAVYTAQFKSIPLADAASDLTITVRGCKSESDSFVFILSSTEISGFKPLEVSIVGNGSSTIKDLTVGKYTVTEEDEWSWRYDAQAPQTVNVRILGEGEKNEVVFDFAEVSFIKKWLSSLAALFK